MASVWAELRRRNVFKVGAAYAIVAWLLIQIADVVLPSFEAPAWVMQVFTSFIILGFPIALLLAWACEMTPEGIRAASKVQPTQSITHATGLMLNYFIVGLLVVAVGFLVVGQYVLEPRANAASSTISTETGSGTGAEQVLRSTITLESTQPVGAGLSAHLALSPDGEWVAFYTDTDATDHEPR